MKRLQAIGIGILAVNLASTVGVADERRFTYSYEPETLPQGAMEFEQWVTLRTQRTGEGAVQQEDFNRWELREELEYGVTDNYTLALYLNFTAESYRDVSVARAKDVSDFEFKGIALENRYMVLNPASHAVGLTLYLEPRFSGEEAEVEQKLILGQRHGNWKWAFNLTHATEWEDNLHSTEGEVEASLGLAYELGKHWSVGLELRDHNELPGYSKWENTVLFLGPVVSYRQGRWWAALTVLPQIYGANFDGDPDGHPNLELMGHERLNLRLIVSLSL